MGAHLVEYVTLVLIKTKMKIKEWKLFQVCWEQAKRACCNKGRLLLPYQENVT